MSDIVLGVGASHSTLMNTNWQEVEALPRAHRFRDALDAASRAIEASAPDVAIIVGSNHFRGFWLDLIPAFTIGIGECIAAGEAGTPSGPQAVDVALARHICNTLSARDFDIAFSARMQVDHGISHAIQYLLNRVQVPIVPLIVNVFAPPLPSLTRCHALARAMREAILGFGARRVAVIASGGLSHELPWPNWQAPKSDDDRYMVDSWLNGRTHWKDYEARRRQIVRAHAPRIAGAFDRGFLADLEHGNVENMLRHSTESLQAEAGNGGQELRTWLMMAALMDYCPGHVLAYEEMPEWLTGMGVALLDPAAPKI
jgi:2,3-dihydroxyphenylpropionate 1,2-dioxygenase